MEGVTLNIDRGMNSIRWPRGGKSKCCWSFDASLNPNFSMIILSTLLLMENIFITCTISTIFYSILDSSIHVLAPIFISLEEKSCHL